MSDAIVEIRDYTIDPDWINAYKDWADTLAAPWLRAAEIVGACLQWTRGRHVLARGCAFAPWSLLLTLREAAARLGKMRALAASELTQLF